VNLRLVEEHDVLLLLLEVLGDLGVGLGHLAVFHDDAVQVVVLSLLVDLLLPR